MGCIKELSESSTEYVWILISFQYDKRENKTKIIKMIIT